MKLLCWPAPAPCPSTRPASPRSLEYTDSIRGRRMMTRSRAFLVVALPMAVLMATNVARVHAQQQQPVTEQPMVSRSGIDLASLDKTANPCDDFYQFACGGWLAKHPVPPDQPRYGRFEELQD